MSGWCRRLGPRSAYRHDPPACRRASRETCPTPDQGWHGSIQTSVAPSFLVRRRCPSLMRTCCAPSAPPQRPCRGSWRGSSLSCGGSPCEHWQPACGFSPRDEQPCADWTIRAFSAQVPLRFAKRAERFLTVVDRSDVDTVRHGGEHRNATIDPDRWQNGWRWFGCFALPLNGNLPLPGATRDGCIADSTGDGMPAAQGDPPQFRQLDPSGRVARALDLDGDRIGEPEAILDTLFAWRRMACQSGPPVPIRAIEVFERLLQRVNGCRLQPIHIGAEHGEFAALAGESERPPRPPPLRPLFESKIIDEPACPRDLRHVLRLFEGRVKPVGVGLALDHTPSIKLAYAG